MDDLDDIARKKQAAEDGRKRKQRAKVDEKRAQKYLDEALKADERAAQQGLAAARAQINAAEARAQRALNEKLKGPDALDGINRILTKPGIRTTKSLSNERAQKVTRRPQGKDGAVSFHFSVTSVAKGGELASVLRGRKSVAAALSSAKPHQKYIEREDAAEKFEIVKEVTNGADRTKVELIQETIVSSFGNIASDPAERDRFWQLVDENEETPSEPVVMFNPTVDLALLSKVQALATKAGERYRALDTAVETQQPTEEQMSHKDALALTRLFQKAGHPPVEFNPATPEQELPIAFSIGAGGRTQIRLVVELPHEMTPIQRLELAQEFAARYEADGLKYWAVIHAPNKHNDDRNYHLHINLYSRPCSLVYHEPSKAMRWDFERVRRYYPSNGAYRLVRITERNKLAAYRARGWVRSERERFATLTNAHLTKAGLPKRLDPRRYEEMGVPDKARIRIPPAAYVRERKGETTAVGVAFAREQWKTNRKAVELIAKSDQSYEAWRRASLRYETRPQLGRGTPEAVLVVNAVTKVAILSAEKTALVTERNALSHVAAKLESRARLKPEENRDDADRAALIVADEIKADVAKADQKIGLTLRKIARTEKAYVTAKRQDDQAIVAEKKKAMVDRMRTIARNVIREVDGPELTAEPSEIEKTPVTTTAPEQAAKPARADGKVDLPVFDEEHRQRRAQQLADMIRKQVEKQREEREAEAASRPQQINIPKPAPASLKPRTLEKDAPEGTPIAANPRMPGKKTDPAVEKVPPSADQTRISKPQADAPEELEKDGLSKETIRKLKAIQERIRQAKSRSR